MSELVSDNETVERELRAFNFAELLRWLGCAGIVLSAVIFLLQGFDDVGAVIRNWAYLILMVALSAIGVALKYVFQDGKSARLLLGLSAAVIPIQFAQLGGMIRTLVDGALVDGASGSALLQSLATVGGVTWGGVAVTGALTLLLTIAVGMFAFRVLARPHAWLLTIANTLLCATLLIPVREGVVAVFVFTGLLMATLLFDRWLSKGSPVLGTGEGRAARLIMLIPMVIVGVRASFYVSDLAAFTVLFGLGSLGAMIAAYQYLNRGPIKELAMLLTASMTVVSWYVWNIGVLSHGSLIQLLTLMPVVSLFYLAVSKMSDQGAIYRYFSAAFTLAGGVQLVLLSQGLLEPTIALVYGLGVAAVGYYQKWRIPALSGGIVGIAAAVAIVFQALAHVELGTWVGLAIGGVTLVVAASLVERYGSSIRTKTQASWQAVSSWS